MFYPTGMIRNLIELSPNLFCMCLLRNFDSSSQKDTFLVNKCKCSNRLLHWSPTVMFYPANTKNNMCNLFDNLFCIFLWHNLYMTCHLRIYLDYKKMVRLIYIN